MEPQPQRCSALLEDRPCQRIDVIAAVVTGTGSAPRHAVMLALHATFGTERAAIGPARFEHEAKASIFVREFSVEVRDGVLLRAGNRVFRFAGRHDVTSMALSLLVVKG